MAVRGSSSPQQAVFNIQQQGRDERTHLLKQQEKQASQRRAAEQQDLNNRLYQSQSRQYHADRLASLNHSTAQAPIPDTSTLFLNAVKAGNAALVNEYLAANRFHALTRYSKEQTPLHVAASLGHEIVVSLLLQAGAEPEAKDDEGSTPLWYAANANKQSTVTVLLEAGADPDNPSKTGMTPLHVAASKVSFAIFSQIAEKSKNLDAVTERGQTAFMYSASGPDAEQKMAFLHERRVDVEKIDQFGQTAFHHSAYKGINFWVEFCLKNGTPVDRKTSSGMTPLMRAAQGGHISTMRLLSNAGADWGSVDTQGRSVLHYAAGRKIECLEYAFLVLNDVGMITSDGDTPLHLAASQGSVECLQFLFERGALVDPKNKKQETPLHLAAKGSRLEAVNLLLSRHADVNARTLTGLTPLHETAFTDGANALAATVSVEIARSLVQHRADVNSRGASCHLTHTTLNDNTILREGTVTDLRPLHFATIKNNGPLADFLFRNGANPRAKDSSGKNAFDYAVQNNSTAVQDAYIRESQRDARRLCPGCIFC